jgi:phage shock protein PspC (stress-responsive transcriptional regulator)
MFDDAGKNIETWYDRTFGPFGPVLSSIFAVIILLIVLYLLGLFGGQRPWFLEIQQFLEPLLIIFILVFLISAYTNYLTKKIKMFRFISPLIGTLVFIFWFWVALEIIAIIGQAFDISILTSFSTIFGILIIPIALLILIIGYASIFTSSQKKYRQDQQTSYSSNSNQQNTPPPQYADGQYKRLYRSGKDKIVGGVLGGIAEYFNVDPTIIRILYVIFLLMSFGTMVLAYIVGWILIPRNPNHHW